MPLLQNLYKVFVIVITFVFVSCHILLIILGALDMLAILYYSSNLTNCNQDIYNWLLFQTLLYLFHIKSNNMLLIVAQVITYVFGWYVLSEFDLELDSRYCNTLEKVWHIILLQQFIMTVIIAIIIIIVFMTVVNLCIYGEDKIKDQIIVLPWYALLYETKKIGNFVPKRTKNAINNDDLIALV